jgi:hypothetical protein
MTFFNLIFTTKVRRLDMGGSRRLAARKMSSSEERRVIRNWAIKHMRAVDGNDNEASNWSISDIGQAMTKERIL